MHFEGLELEIFPEVYEPAEDSFLLAKYAKSLRGRILDMGCGCGIQSLVCAGADPESVVLGVDLNPRAVENSMLNAGKNRIRNAAFMESDLFSAITGKFDAIIFNPPYLPTSAEERVQGKLNLAFDGGAGGRAVTGKFLAQFSGFLKKRGTLLMIESSLAGIGKTMRKLQNSGFEVKILEEEKFFFENIAVIWAKRRRGRDTNKKR